MLTTHRYGYRIVVERHNSITDRNGFWRYRIHDGPHPEWLAASHEPTVRQALMQAFYDVDQLVRREA